MQKRFVSILLFVISVAGNTAAAEVNEHTSETQRANTGNIRINGLDPLTLLRSHRYDELDRRLNMLQFDYERNTDHELEVKKAMSRLSLADPEIESLFQDWLKLYPNSYAAKLSAGSYYMSMAMQWRGNKSFNETHPKRIEKMNQYLEKASTQLEKSIQFSGKPTISYSKLIAIARYRGDNEAISHWFAEALKHDPLCAAPRIAYMRTLEPRWGGSRTAMLQFAGETHKVGYPKIEKLAKMFEGWIYWYDGYQNYLNKNYVAALNEFNKAIALDPINEGGFITNRAHIYQIVGQTDLAMADIALQLQSDPLSAEALLLRGYILLDKWKPAEALKDINTAAELYDIAAMRELGYLYTRGNLGVPMNMEEGIKWFKKAAYFMDEHSSYMLGGMSERGLGMPVDYVAAVKYYRIAAEQGYGSAINDLGMMLWYGRGTPVNRDEAIQLWIEGSEKNVWQSKHNLHFFLSSPELFKLALHHPQLFMDDKRLLFIGICLILILLLISRRLIVMKRPKPQQNIPTAPEEKSNELLQVSDRSQPNKSIMANMTISSEEIAKINKGMLPLNIIWAGMLISLFIYLRLGLYIQDTLRITMEKNVIDTLRNVLYVVSFITLFATRFVRNRFLSGKGKSAIINASQQSYQSDRPTALARYTSAMVVSLAMTESIGIYGLVLFFVGKNQVDLYLFILISAATMLIYRPKRDEIISLTQELNKQGTNESLQQTL